MSKYLIVSALLVILVGAFYILFLAEQGNGEINLSLLPMEENTKNKVEIKTAQTQTIAEADVAKNIKQEKQKNILDNLNNDAKSFLSDVKDAELFNISRNNIEKFISELQNQGENHQDVYIAILNMYKSNMPDGKKIFLASLLGEVSTHESTLTLMKILDLDSSNNSSIVYENIRAINNLIYNDKDGKINKDVSSALMEHWEKSDNITYKPVITKAILKIGNKKESEKIIDSLNNAGSDTVRYISSAMKEIRNEQVTKLLYIKYNSKQSSEIFKNTSLEALPYIANKTAILSLYDWSLKTIDIEKVEEYFEIIKHRNPNAEMIIKDELFYNKVKFNSNDVKISIEKIFKK